MTIVSLRRFRGVLHRGIAQFWPQESSFAKAVMGRALPSFSRVVTINFRPSITTIPAFNSRRQACRPTESLAVLGIGGRGLPPCSAIRRGLGFGATSGSTEASAKSLLPNMQCVDGKSIFHCHFFEPAESSALPAVTSSHIGFQQKYAVLIL